MALPDTYNNTKTYFEDCLSFLQTYKWIHSTPNTHILVNKIFNNISKEWLSYFQTISIINLNNIALGIIDNEAPESFKAFMQNAIKLKPNYLVKGHTTISQKNIKLGRKKAHEIYNLAPVIHKKCVENGVQHVVDIGAGLGYLPQLLNEKFNYNILGIEGNPDYVKTATKNNNSSSIHYKHHFVTPNSTKIIENLFFESFPNVKNGICLTALHACADLTIEILNLFKNLEIAKCAVVMPCCYHRIKGCDEIFDNFPCSDELKLIYAKPFLTRPFLRLACQQTDSIWKEMDENKHKLHSKNCLFRNIFQEVLEEGNFKTSRTKRKTGTKNLDYTIEEYAEDLENSYKFFDNKDIELGADSVALIKSNVCRKYYDNYVGSDCYIEALTAMQGLIQSVCENLILLDRCGYVKQFGIECVTEKITDDCISPRCYAFVLNKI